MTPEFPRPVRRGSLVCMREPHGILSTGLAGFGFWADDGL